MPADMLTSRRWYAGKDDLLAMPEPTRVTAITSVLSANIVTLPGAYDLGLAQSWALDSK
jgi:hypothetical protein